MSDSSKVKLTFNFNDPDLEPEERDEQVQMLMVELQQMDDLVDSIERVSDPTPPNRSKSIGGVLIGLLTAEISVENTQRVMRLLGDRLGGKPIELSVEANGKKLTVKAHSREELESAIQAAQDFIAK